MFSIPGRGGRTEVFVHQWSREITPDYDSQTFEVADVSSLYPYIGISNLFPTGEYKVITQPNIINSIYYDQNRKVHSMNNSSHLIGLAQVRIVAPRHLKEPFLPILRKSDQRIIFALCELCVQKNSLSECYHDDIQRSTICVLTWPELNFLVGELNYKIITIYELYNYETESPLFSTFLKLIAHGKLKHIISDHSDDNLKFINKKMKFPPSMALISSDIDLNPEYASFYKKILVSIMGKIAQVNNRTVSKFVRNQNQLQSIFYTEKIDDLFDYGNVCHVVIKPAERSNENRSGNSIIYSYVTALARIYMHRCIMKLESVGACVHAIENDCIYFTRPKTLQNPLIYSQTFGYFHKEFNNCIITSFNSFGSKSSSISYIENGILKHKIKAKGFSLQSSIINSILEFESFQELLCHYVDNKIVNIEVPQIHVVKNIKKLSVNQILRRIKLTNVIITKRIFLRDYKTHPYGYTIKREEED